MEKPGYRTCAVMKPWRLKYNLYSHRTICFIAKCENSVAPAEYKTRVCYHLALGSLLLNIFKNVLDNLQASMNFILAQKEPTGCTTLLSIYFDNLVLSVQLYHDAQSTKR